MPLDTSKIGSTSEIHRRSYTWRDQAAYALGVGAKRGELDYLYERVAGGMKVLPTYAVVPAFPAVLELLAGAGADFSMVVHGGQKIRVHRPVPPQGELHTVGELTGLYDMKRFASLVVATRTTLEGEPLFDTEWNIIVRDAGGFGGARPPPDPDAVKPPKGKPPKGRDPDWQVAEATTPEQALLYRLSGDDNPLHADPAFAASVGFEQGPILHGLCTFGFVARAAIRERAGGDATRLRAMAAQFRKPVWPGETIVTSGWDLDDGRIALQATVEGRPDPVVTNAWALLDRGGLDRAAQAN